MNVKAEPATQTTEERLKWIIKEMENRAGTVNRTLTREPVSSGYSKSGHPEAAFFKAFDMLAKGR